MPRQFFTLIDVESGAVGLTANCSAVWREASRLRGKGRRRVFDFEEFVQTAIFLARLSSSDVGSRILEMPDSGVKRFLGASICGNAGLATWIALNIASNPVDRANFVRQLAGALSPISHVVPRGSLRIRRAASRVIELPCQQRSRPPEP